MSAVCCARGRTGPVSRRVVVHGFAQFAMAGKGRPENDDSPFQYQGKAVGLLERDTSTEPRVSYPFPFRLQGLALIRMPTPPLPSLARGEAAGRRDGALAGKPGPSAIAAAQGRGLASGSDPA